MATRPTIYTGNKGTSVVTMKRLLKKHLAALGQTALNSKITLTMTYGPDAVNGVKYMQRRYKLVVDGIVGPKTWAVLEKAAYTPPTTLTIYSRESWGAKAPQARVKCDWTAYTTTRLHHTVTSPPSSGLTGTTLLNTEKQKMREIQQIAFSRGFSDISYSYLIFPSGHVFEGRGFEVLGAHTLGHNADVGVALVGNYENQTVTKAQKEALYKLRQKIAVSRGSLIPHCRTFSTSCPGKNARAAWGISC